MYLVDVECIFIDLKKIIFVCVFFVFKIFVKYFVKVEKVIELFICNFIYI